MMQKGDRVMGNDLGLRSTEYPVSPKKIELVFLNWCTQPAGNPHRCAPLDKLMAKVTLI
jgi:hypothetical protein